MKSNGGVLVASSREVTMTLGKSFMQIVHPSTTILFIDHHDDDRQYGVRRLSMSSPVMWSSKLRLERQGSDLPVAAG